eukprot:g1702.t1
MLTQIFGAVGPVLNFRIVRDRETGQGKGFGFCQYPDSATALSAMRNLNGYEISGRTLRVAFASGSSKKTKDQEALLKTPNDNDLSMFTNEEKKQASENAVENAVATFPPHVLWDIMSQMKDVVRRKPKEARELLIKYPQLMHGLLRAQMALGMVQTTVPGVPEGSMPQGGGSVVRTTIGVNAMQVMPPQPQYQMPPQLQNPPPSQPQYQMPPQQPQYQMPPPPMLFPPPAGNVGAAEYEPPTLAPPPSATAAVIDPRRRRRGK